MNLIETSQSVNITISFYSKFFCSSSTLPVTELCSIHHWRTDSLVSSFTFPELMCVRTSQTEIWVQHLKRLLVGVRASAVAALWHQVHSQWHNDHFSAHTRTHTCAWPPFTSPPLKPDHHLVYLSTLQSSASKLCDLWPLRVGLTVKSSHPKSLTLSLEVQSHCKCCTCSSSDIKLVGVLARSRWGNLEVTADWTSVMLLLFKGKLQPATAGPKAVAACELSILNCWLAKRQQLHFHNCQWCINDWTETPPEYNKAFS